jgi:hypothetical protein
MKIGLERKTTLDDWREYGRRYWKEWIPVYGFYESLKNKKKGEGILSEGVMSHDDILGFIYVAWHFGPPIVFLLNNFYG